MGKLNKGSIIRLLVVLATISSLSSLPAQPLSNFRFPIIRLAHADIAPDEFWYPAGPAMDTVLATIFTDESAEFQNMCALSSNGEDIMDQALTRDQVNSIQMSQCKPFQNYYLTSGTSTITKTNAEGGFTEIEFNLARTFWGCPMNFGTSQCGREIRQGIAHLIDKVQFTVHEAALSGYVVPIDNPLPADNGGIPAPNPCSWDSSFLQKDSGCHVGAPGGEAYHNATATGVNYPWQPSLGSPDFCAAAQHFVNAGLASGKNGSTCVLKGVSASVTTYSVKFDIVDDYPALLDLGASVAQEICALFTGSFTTGCGTGLSSNNILAAVMQPSNLLSAQSTLTAGLNQDWSMYTSGPPGYASLDVFQEVADHLTDLGCLPSPPSCKDPFDSTLYFVFNSRFVSVPSAYQTPSGSCSNLSTPSNRAPDYMYLCNANYDSISNNMEFANCLTAQIGTDPTVGQTTPTFGTCTAGGSSALSAGYQAEDFFGSNAFTIPIYNSQGQQYVYLHYTPGNPSAAWQRVITHPVAGPNNYFTWLNAYNSAPVQPGTIRVMMGGSTSTVNPYAASTPYDMAILSSIYDSLGATNPLADSQYLDWAAQSSPQTSLSYSPPAGTCTGQCTYRFTLDPNLNWQDGKSVTSFDVAFSYLSLVAYGAFQSVGAASFMTGITILSPTQFDINVNSNNGLFSKIALTSLTILPGRYWTCNGLGTANVPCTTNSQAQTAWGNLVAACTTIGNSCYPVQYTLGTSSGSQSRPVGCALSGCSNIKNATALMTADPQKVVPTYDPIQNHILIGSGPWTCGSGSGLGLTCAPGNIMNPGPNQSYAFQRNGLGVSPGFSGDYFRSSGFLATWLWSGDIQPGVNNFSAAKQCFGAAPVPLSPTPPDPSSCAHWQQGIGTNGATTAPGTGGCPGAPNTSPCGIPVGSTQLSIVSLWINFNWVYPYVWNSANPPQGIGALDPVLYAGSGGTLSPAQGTGGVGCGSAYPTGGYDC